MIIGKIYLCKKQESCEIIAVPETPESIQKTQEAVEEAGFRILNDAPHIGNFAIRLTEERSLLDLQNIISGEIVE